MRTKFRKWLQKIAYACFEKVLILYYKELIFEEDCLIDFKSKSLSGIEIQNLEFQLLIVRKKIKNLLLVLNDRERFKFFRNHPESVLDNLNTDPGVKEEVIDLEKKYKSKGYEDIDDIID